MRVREEQERLDDAIRVSRRLLRMPGNLAYLSTFGRERARILARAGRLEEARFELRRYLAMRQAASPELQADLERARSLLARLTAER